MNLKSLNVSLVALVGLGLLITMSAFTAKPEKESKRVTYFYKYKLNTFSQAQIENPVNYERSDEPCDEGTNVCGVYLPTNTGASAQPNSLEFNSVKSNLWDSQQNHEPVSDIVVMRN